MMGAIIALLMALPFMLVGSILTGGTYIEIPTLNDISKEAYSILDYFTNGFPALISTLSGLAAM